MPEGRGQMSLDYSQYQNSNQLIVEMLLAHRSPHCFCYCHMGLRVHGPFQDRLGLTLGLKHNIRHTASCIDSDLAWIK
jgi:hypothetical protein